MRMSFKLEKTENNNPLSEEQDRDFLLLMQRAALLGLKETGLLSEIHHRQAEAELLRQFHTGRYD